ncbi:winged helix DNA-binding domain-containing protein [Cellulomonas fengjieae]|uniref:winged helix DNA-binding domain-containing protein n=1 Tax=Cellulomonas fengjieae TaxID=2819978 RepID=UPI001AAE3653|nr:winged helix DNA-binding domain-containing protein [Cellulomonas fengjieae]MBO3101370.1 AlkZ family DNA glycosylase [Cellulomonas fengjieae]
MTELLTRARLNRALLARQHLLERRPGPALDVVDRLVGMQAQNAWSPYVGLWSRVEGFAPDHLAAAFWDRSVTRIAVMRGTIHLVTAADALVLPGLLAPLYAKDLRVNASHGAALRTIDLAELTAAARALVEAEPRVTTELGRLLADRWPDVATSTLAYAARGTLPLVQVPPRGVWGRSGATTWTTATAWLGPELTAAAPDLGDPAVHAAQQERLVLRYLAAFGPASVADLQTWSGLTGLREVVDRLDLVRYRAEPSPGAVRERELLDVPEGPLPDAEVAAPVRFLADYDNVLLSHADRTRIIAPEHRRRLASPNGVFPATFLLDGRVAGTWEMPRDRRARDRVTLTVRPFGALTAAQRDEVRAEAEGLAALMADEAAERPVVVVEPD